MVQEMKNRRFTYLLTGMALWLAGGSGAVRAQQRGVPSETLSAAWAPVKVEHYVGVRGGYAMGSIRFEPSRPTKMKMGLMVGGLVYKFDVPAQKYVGCIEADVNWSQKGYRVRRYFDSEEVSERVWNVIEVPILWQPYLPLGKGGSRFYLSAGPYVSYAVDSRMKEFNEVTGEVLAKGKYEYDPTRDNRWEYGVTFGAGFLVAIRRFSISAEFRYNIGLSDLYKGVTKYEGNPFRSPADQMAVTLGVNYKIRMHNR